MNKNWIWSVVALVAVAAASYALYLYLQPAKLPDGILYGNGRVEATEVRIASEVGGRVVESRLVEGRVFHRGDLLVRIDDTDLRLRLAQAQADRLVLDRGRLKAAALVQTARHHTGTAATNAVRFRNLAAANVVSAQQRDVAENSLSDARGGLSGGEAALSQIAAQLESADKAIALIQDQIKKTRILAPQDGTVLIKAIEPGEVVAAGQNLAVMADITHLELKVYVPESDIGRIKLGGQGRVGTDAFPGHYAQAFVERIDQEAQFTPRDIHLPEERATTVFGVTLAVANPHGELKPGMPVDAWVKWKPDREWPSRLVVPQ